MDSFYFIRHGITDANLQHIIMGQLDPHPLNNEGTRQAQYAAQALINTDKPQVICHSPALRALQTAKIIHSVIGGTLLEVPELHEANLGELQGKRSDKEQLQNWDKGTEILGAESAKDFRLRVEKAFNQISLIEGKILIVSHALWFRQLSHYLTGHYHQTSNCIPLLIEKTPLTHWTITPLASWD